MNYVFSVPGAIVASGALLFVVMKAFDYFAPQPQRRPPPPPPPPVIKRDYTLAGGRPLLTAINGYVFDLASHPTGPSFYGPGETYHVFTGRDATIMFAKTELSAKAVEGLTLESLNIGERDTLRDWQMRLEMKYNIVGYLTDGLVPRSLASEAALEAKAKAAKQATASSSNVDKKD